MTIVFEGGYPFRCQRTDPRLIFRIIYLRQVSRLTPAFIAVKFDPDPVPVATGLIQDLTAFSK